MNRNSMSERFYDWSEAGHRQSLIPNKTVVEYERLFSFSDITEAEGLRIIQQKVWNFFCDNIKKYGFSEREGQQDMALDIAEAIAEKKHLIVEAGVGIGKSFAYIVPLLFFHQQYKRPIVISTSTITLQEQLVDDIGRISEILNYPIQIIVAKGQTHYVCRRKVEELPNSKERGALLAAIEKNASERTHFPFAIGRLIRSETDRGIISIIDPRLSQKSNSPYRQIVLDSLPIKNCTSDLDVLRAFYGKIAP